MIADQDKHQCKNVFFFAPHMLFCLFILAENFIRLSEKTELWEDWMTGRLRVNFTILFMRNFYSSRSKKHKKTVKSSVEKKLTNLWSCCTLVDLRFTLCAQIWWNWPKMFVCVMSLPMLSNERATWTFKLHTLKFCSCGSVPALMLRMFRFTLKIITRWNGGATLSKENKTFKPVSWPQLRYT